MDWKSQVHVLKLQEYRHESWFLDKLFERLFKRVVGGLQICLPDQRFKISLRLYHGWYRGFEEQTIRKQVRVHVLGPSFAKATQSSIAFISGVSFGDCLLSAKPERMHRSGIHLPNTFRRGAAANKPPYEKMVDTAIAADLMAWAARFAVDGGLVCDSDVAVVLGEDDDLWPPVLAAEPMWLSWGGVGLVIQDDLPSADMPQIGGLTVESYLGR